MLVGECVKRVHDLTDTRVDDLTDTRVDTRIENLVKPNNLVNDVNTIFNYLTDH